MKVERAKEEPVFPAITVIVETKAEANVLWRALNGAAVDTVKYNMWLQFDSVYRPND